jgi:FMN phosphatase YigB (HAD superfamily)
MAFSDTYRALTFDVGGTIFDWHSAIRDEVAAFAASKGVELDAVEFANDRRRGLFTDVMPKVRSGAPHSPVAVLEPSERRERLREAGHPAQRLGRAVFGEPK